MLYNHQRQFVLGKHNGHLLAWSCGSGKSKASLHAVMSQETETMIVCPKSLLENWQEEIETARVELGVNFYGSVISKEDFRKKHKFLPPCENLIIDEAHYFSGHKSQMFKSMLWYVKKWHPQKTYLLTATPYLSTPFNILCYGQLLGANPLTWNYWKFKTKFYDDIRMGNRTVPVLKRGVEDDIAKLVSQLGTTYKLDDLFDVPEQIYEKEFFSINKEQKKTMEEVIDVLPIVRFTKFHQIESGTLKRDYQDDLELPCEKTTRIIELCKEHKKIAIVARYNAQLFMYKKILHDVFPGRDIRLINGKNNHRQEDVDVINNLDDAIVLINSACSEGYNLWSVPTMIFASMDFSFKNTEQLKGRILRANKLKKNVYIFLLTKGKESVDLGVYQSYLSKQDFDIKIFCQNKK